jgi:hypothetical protein
LKNLGAEKFGKRRDLEAGGDELGLGGDLEQG